MYMILSFSLSPFLLIFQVTRLVVVCAVRKLEVEIISIAESVLGDGKRRDETVYRFATP